MVSFIQVPTKKNVRFAKAAPKKLTAKQIANDQKNLAVHN